MENNTLQEILERVIRMEAKLDDYPNFKEKANISYQKSTQNEKDIAEIKENNKWIVRSLVGELITIVGGAIALYLGLK